MQNSYLWIILPVKFSWWNKYMFYCINFVVQCWEYKIHNDEWRIDSEFPCGWRKITSLEKHISVWKAFLAITCEVLSLSNVSKYKVLSWSVKLARFASFSEVYENRVSILDYHIPYNHKEEVLLVFCAVSFAN